MARCNENLALLFVEFGREEYLFSYLEIYLHIGLRKIFLWGCIILLYHFRLIVKNAQVKAYTETEPRLFIIYPNRSVL